MSSPAEALVYMSQSDPQNSRSCGAACLSMVYRALGADVSQGEIWKAIAKENMFGSLASTTHLMAKDAIAHGFVAAIVQARHPLQILKECCDSGMYAVLNHRLNRDTGAGHYSVLVNIDREKVVVHDPLYGPSRSFPHAEFLELWQPRVAGSEIGGNVLVGIAADPQPLKECKLCGTPFPDAMECPNCKQPVALQPAMLFGCMSGACGSRLWNHLYCPSCDFSWTFDIPAPAAEARSLSGAPAEGSASRPQIKLPPPSKEDPWNLAALFGELDKFNAYLLSLPAVANHPEIARLQNLIAAQKDKLCLAQAETIAVQKAQSENFAALQETANKKKEEIEQKREEQRKKTEEQKAPSAALDPDALRVALLKNLGWTR